MAKNVSGLELGTRGSGKEFGKGSRQAHLQCVHVTDSSAGHDGICHSFLELPVRAVSECKETRGGIR